MRSTCCIVLLAVLAAGCGDKGESLADKAGEAVGKQVTDFTKGVGRGVDQRMLVEVSLQPELLALGVTNTIAKSQGLASNKKGISVYLIASRSFSNSITARALNDTGAEIGRSRSTVHLQKDEASYVTFEFPEEMDGAMVKRYVLGP